MRWSSRKTVHILCEPLRPDPCWLLRISHELRTLLGITNQLFVRPTVYCTLYFV